MKSSPIRIGLLLALAICPRETRGQTPAATPGNGVVHRPIADRYEGGLLRRKFLGTAYRDLWSTPVSIPVLDLATFGGGLHPVERGGGLQTSSLRFRAPDGREYQFRSIDKDPTRNLTPELQGTIAADIAQDQTSSLHPTGPLVVADLLEAAGVLHATPQLFALPDDPRLGEFRADFGGVVGMLEQRIELVPGDTAPWSRGTEVISGKELMERVDRSPDDRVDARAFLKARLLDMLVGDWDRHREQWTWVRFGDAMPRIWVPIPKDRDYAMVRFDGLFLTLARHSKPSLIDFAPEYSEVLGLTWNGRELDRKYLLTIERTAWDSVVAEVRAAITDPVIEQAVHRLPSEHFALNGAYLIQALKKRRDDLPEVANSFYRMLAEAAEVYGTEVSEIAEIRGVDKQTIEVSLSRFNTAAAPPYLTRRFRSAETREIRVFLGDGADSAVLTGIDPDHFTVRVIGGDGKDALVGLNNGKWARMYDYGDQTTVSRGIHLDRFHYNPPPKRYDTEIPPRDWGSRREPGAFAAAGPDIGVFFGLTQTLTVYRFRRLPFASRHRLRAGIATGPWTYRADYLGQFREGNSGSMLQILARASGIEVLRFHGFGNAVAAPGDNEFYRVTSDQYSLGVTWLTLLGNTGALSFGPRVRFVSTDDHPDRFLTTLDPYGSEDFGEVGGIVSLELKNHPEGDSSAVQAALTIAGSGYPAAWDVQEAYGEVHGNLATSIRIGAPLDPILVLRAGGKKLWGRYPYFDAAFIGSNSTVRLGRENRYAGDASVYGSAELSLALTKIFLGAPGDLGILGLSDVGRVYLAGEDSRDWHGALGMGIWISFLDRFNRISLAVIESEERTALNLQANFGF